MENEDYTGAKTANVGLASARNDVRLPLDPDVVRRSIFDVASNSIPRWLLIATAALLAFAIFVIVVHPYYDVSNATAVERVLLAFVVTAVAGAFIGLRLAPTIALASLPKPVPLPIAERNCIRRI